jgi:hypothetical protein
MIKELTISNLQLSSFSQPDQNQQHQQQIPIHSNPQHTIHPISETHPETSTGPDLLRLCNDLFRKVHELHELRHSNIPSERYVAQWVSLTEELVERLHNLQEADVEEQKKFDKGKTINAEEVIQTQEDKERNHPESSAVRENIEQNLRDMLASKEDDLNEPFQDNLGANQEHLRNPVYEADIRRIEAKVDKYVGLMLIRKTS